MIRYSIKQILRTPVKSFFFLLLITVAGIFLSLGSVLWITNSSNIRAYEETFITIGTVEQRASSIKQTVVWDAERKDYSLWQDAEYHTILPVSLLFFEGANYIKEPEKRSYYGSYAPEYNLVSKNNNLTQTVVAAVEISPLQDCIPNESVQVRVNKVLLGDSSLEGTTIWFCVHDQPEPESLYKEKSYAVFLNLQHEAHGDNYEKLEGIEGRNREYIPLAPLSTQYEPDGTSMKDLLTEDSLYFEVNQGFYNTDIGRRFLNLAKGYAMLKRTQPVTGTNATILLMPFYNGDAYISEGRDIQEEEYENGEHVCLVSKKFAENNQLSIGNSVHLQLYYTNSRNSASQNFLQNGNVGINFNIIDIKGDAFSVFEDNLYTIVGIYQISSGAEQGSYSMGGDEVIIPIGSIENRDKCNILAYGPMKGNTTSFQIPNGTVEQFMAAWEKYSSGELEIVFYDMGYSELKYGIENMKHMSLILLVVSLLMIVFLLLFYSHLFIARQKERTAIERCLGMGKPKCRISLLSGILMILLFGSALGCGIGGVVSQHISTENLNKVYYDTYYSSVVDVEMEEEAQEGTGDEVVALAVSLTSMGLIVLLGIVISINKINRNLKCEPMELLSEKRIDR